MARFICLPKKAKGVVKQLEDGGFSGRFSLEKDQNQIEYIVTDDHELALWLKLNFKGEVEQMP